VQRLHKLELRFLWRLALTIKRIVKLGTRKSLLAMTQSTWVKNKIEQKWPDVEVQLVKITTKGDKILDVPLAKVGGKGLFVKEIEEALLRKDIDIAVHSLKDVPAELPDGLEVSVFPEREDARDALISRNGQLLKDLPQGARIGTSSLRRVAQLRKVRPDFQIEALRGNLDTRLKKLEDGEFDAIILAAAGLNRLSLSDKITECLDPELMLPAVGQGALGIEFRCDDDEIKKILASIHHEETAICVKAERAFLARLEGGCQVPIGAHATLCDGELELDGMVGDEEGMRIIRMRMNSTPDKADALGRELGTAILENGGREILRELYEKG